MELNEMSKARQIEEVFLLVLQENTNRDEIDKKIQYFNVSDWQRLYELATKNGLFPIFYHQLLSLRLENLPTEFLSKLKNLYFLNLKKNIILEQELFKVIEYLNKNNISVIPLKGPVSARFLYNDLALRQASCDLDLLVRPEMVEEIEKKLKEIGYIFNPMHGSIGFFHKFRTQVMLQRHIDGLSGISLDLHWDFRDKFSRTHIEEFWLNATYREIDGYQVLMPSSEDLLLFLTLTTISDFDFIQLKYLYDIHTFFRKFGGQIDWEKISIKARQLNLDAALFFALRLCVDLFDVKLSRELLGIIKPAAIKEKLCKLWINKDNILRSANKTASGFTWRYIISSLLYSNNIFNCAKIVLNKIFLPMDEVIGFYGYPCGKKSYLLYAKRLLKPILHKI